MVDPCRHRGQSAPPGAPSCAEAASIEAVSRAFGALESAVEDAAGDGGHHGTLRGRVRDCMAEMRTELLYAARHPFIDRARTFETINGLNYATNLEILAPGAENARDLHWLAHTLAAAGCLGLWREGRVNAELAIAGVYPMLAEPSLIVGEVCAPRAFPPLRAFEPAMRAHPDQLLMLLPLQTIENEWGALALLSPPEAQILTADAGVWQWTAPLMAALARERLLELLRESERRGAEMALERERIEKEAFRSAAARLEDLNRELAETDRLKTALLEQSRAQAAAAAELAQVRSEQAAQAEALTAVTSALAGALEPEQVYAAILDQVHRVLPYDHAAVLLHQDGWVIVAGSRGVMTLEIGARVFPVARVAGVAAFGAGGAPAIIRDTAALPGWIVEPPFVGERTIRSVLVVPLLVEGRVVGTFNVDSFVPHFYTERHLGLAVTFAEHVTQALRNARLYALERERARAAEDLARLRSDFVAAVSHELRTPLTAIVGIAELLEARWDQFGDERRRLRIAQIALAANRQKRLVDDLLLVSRLETTSLAIAPASTPLGAAVRPVIEEVRAGYPGQRVSTEGCAGIAVWADPARLAQVLANLLDNAAKYSPEGSPIEVAWRPEDGMVALRVRDHGPGIPDAGRDHLFTRFGRLSGSRTRAGRVGTGLGLYLSRGLAEAMGGTLDLEVTGTSGSTFRLRLPAAPPERRHGGAE